MSGSAAPGRVRALATAGWGKASREGVLASAIVLAVALGAALAAVALGRLGAGARDVLRIGGAYLALAHRIPLRLALEGPDLALARVIGAPADAASLEVRVAAAPLALTALAGWLLWRAGRRTGERLGGSGPARALHGAKVAPAYAALVALATLPARATLAPAALELRAEISAPPGPALLLPLGLAAAVGALGAWWSAGTGGMARAAALGGWRMLTAGLGLALAGLFVAGVVRPDGPEALLTPTTGRYLRAVLARPAVGALGLAHHVAVLPNEATWTLVPAMGGCLAAVPSEGEPSPFLCYGRFPRSLRLPVWLRPPGVGAGPPTSFGVAPWPVFAFLLVPAAATVLGGLRAARAEPPRPLPAAILAGAVFAVLVLALGWTSSLSVSATARTAGAPLQVRSVRVGPELASGTALALGWGVAGGALGAALRGWSGPRRGGSRRAR